MGLYIGFQKRQVILRAKVNFSREIRPYFPKELLQIPIIPSLYNKIRKIYPKSRCFPLKIPRNRSPCLTFAGRKRFGARLLPLEHPGMLPHSSQN